MTPSHRLRPAAGLARGLARGLTRGLARGLAGALLAAAVLAAPAAPQFVNWETPHVHPLDMTPDGTRLLAVNTPDARLEVFDLTTGTPILVDSVAVGLDPVSVRARSNGEAWVVNHVSDSISLVDLATGRVTRTLATGDEPADVVFAGAPLRAFVTCSQVNIVQVFDLANLDAAPAEVEIFGEDPRALAVSPDGGTVYAAVFESGNGSTVLGGGLDMGNGGFPPNVVSDNAGPYNGTNPPPNVGNAFDPPQNPANPTPPRVSLIVKKDDLGRWMDDNGGDWTDLVSGPDADKSGRPVGWDLPDHDVAVLDADTLALSYVNRLMNLNMALGVNPVDGRLAVVGTDGINEVRFEPVLQGIFLRVNAALVDVGGATTSVVDLNPHLDYTTPTVPQNERDKALGDPRGAAWNAAGTRLWVTGMGSNNLVVLDTAGARSGLAETIEVGEGPTGIQVDDARGQVYVLNKFDSSISVVSTSTELETTRVGFHDSSPVAIQLGRRQLYDTHRNSGLGHVACASCHVDARMDQLAWDLGAPDGDMISTAGQNLSADIPFLTGPHPDWHPMKGPMTTQTFQDIIGMEPHHWRGDRTGLEEFAEAFVGLQGDDVLPTPLDIQEFEDFLSTVHFPPNPFRNFDNSLPTAVDLSDFHTTGDFGPAGQSLGVGNAVTGLALYRPPNLLDSGALACVTCHTLPTGLGPDMTLNGGFVFQPIPPGPDGERHHALVNMDGFTNVTLKIPHLRNMHEKGGFDMTQQLNTRGFGFVHDGAVDTVARFIGEPVFSLQNDQEVADMLAFMLAFPGSDLPEGSATNLLEPPGTPSKDTHAGVGRQTTLVDAGAPAPGQLTLLGDMLALADAGAVDVVVHGVQGGLDRGYVYLGGGQFQSDRAADTVAAATLQAGAAPGSELTYTVVPEGSGTRLGVDRDLDGAFDRDELDAGSDPADPLSLPGAVTDVHVAAFDLAVVSRLVGPGPAPGAGGLRVQTAGQKHRAEATLRVEDDQGQPVAGVLVSVNWSGTTAAPGLSAVTDGLGEVTFVSPPSGLASHCWTLTLEGLSGDGLAHDTGSDVASEGSVGNACP